MSQHTPGPWINAFDLGEIINAQRVIARLLRGGPMYVAEDEANARLIAAAPELLEVLNEVCHTYTDLPAWLSAKLASVLAKAEGRKPVSLQEEIDRG